MSRTRNDQFSIAFLGFGEAAYGISRGLKGEGLTSIAAYDKRQDDPDYGPTIRARAEDAQVTLVESPHVLAATSRIIVSAVVSAEAQDAARALAPDLTCEHTYVDLNSASPRTKAAVAQIVERSGARMVDLAIMGPIPTYGHKVPALASGSGACALARFLNSYGMNIREVGSKPGDASAIKMLRSVFMKGAAALLIEMLVAADKCASSDIVLESVLRTLGELAPADLVRRLVCGTAVHSERRAHEMQEVVETLEYLGSVATMSRATRDMLEWVTSLGLRRLFSGIVPEDPKEVAHAINERSAQG